MLWLLNIRIVKVRNLFFLHFLQKLINVVVLKGIIHIQNRLNSFIFLYLTIYFRNCCKISMNLIPSLSTSCLCEFLRLILKRIVYVFNLSTQDFSYFFKIKSFFNYQMTQLPISVNSKFMFINFWNRLLLIIRLTPNTDIFISKLVFFLLLNCFFLQYFEFLLYCLYLANCHFIIKQNIQKNLSLLQFDYHPLNDQIKFTSFIFIIFSHFTQMNTRNFALNNNRRTQQKTLNDFNLSQSNSLDHFLPKSRATQKTSKDSQNQLKNFRNKQQSNKLSQMQKNKKYKNEKCAVCLGCVSQDYALLKCNHVFCFDCAKQWWKQQNYCPYCRVQIQYLQKKNGSKLYIDNLSQMEQVDDNNFIPQCEACWGDVEQTEQFMICSICSSIYIHQRCLSFRCRKWECYQCSMIADNLQICLPIVPYNKVIHYISIHLDRNHKQFQTRRIDNC